MSPFAFPLRQQFGYAGDVPRGGTLAVDGNRFVMRVQVPNIHAEATQVRLATGQVTMVGVEVDSVTIQRLAANRYVCGGCAGELLETNIRVVTPNATNPTYNFKNGSFVMPTYGQTQGVVRVITNVETVGISAARGLHNEAGGGKIE